MRRLLIPLIVALGLTGAVAATADATPRAKAKTYTVTRTFGPYNGQAHWSNDLPGQLPDGKALWVACDPFDALTAKAMTVTRLSGKKALRLDSKGVEFATYEPDDAWMFYAWFSPTGKRGWDKVTMSVTCRDTAAPFRG